MSKHQVGDIEIREPLLVTGEEELDEVILNTEHAYVHLEKMDDDAWWMAIGTPNGKIHVTFWISGTRSRTAKIDADWYPN